jgi:hypothetical protein
MPQNGQGYYWDMLLMACMELAQQSSDILLMAQMAHNHFKAVLPMAWVWPITRCC